MALIRVILLLLVCCAPADGAIRFRKILLRGNPPIYVPPSDLPNLFGWWKADTITNLVNGTEVAFWTDSSGHGFHMRPLSTGATTSPYWTNNFQNGLPAVFFDGINDKLTNACTIEQTNVFFFVMQHRIPGAAEAVLFDGQDTPTANELESFIILHTDYASNRMESGAISLYGKNPGTNVTTTYTLQYAVGDSAIWTNGVLAATGPIGTFGLQGGMIVGASRESDSWFKGHLMEMFCMTNTYATQGTVLQDGVNYLRNKWGHY